MYGHTVTKTKFSRVDGLPYFLNYGARSSDLQETGYIAQKAYCSPDIYFQSNKNYRSVKLAPKNDSNGSHWSSITRSLSLREFCFAH